MKEEINPKEQKDRVDKHKRGGGIVKSSNA
jgi:hypothetical protein